MTPAEITTVILSSIAIVISIINFIWNVVRARRKRPEVTVTGDARFAVDGAKPADPYWSLSVNVANTGGRAASVLGASWLINGIHYGTGDEFPMRLEPHDSKQWNVQMPVGGTKLEGMTCRPAVRVVQRPTYFERRQGISTERYIFGPPGRIVSPPASVYPGFGQ